MDLKKILFKTTSIDVDNSLPDAVIFIDKEGKIQWINDVASELFETSKIHLMTSNISDFIENSKNIISNALISNKSSIVKLTDKECYLSMTARNINEGYVLAFRRMDSIDDTTEQNEDSKIINYDKNNFLIKLANDLKAPIQSIVGFSQAMSDGLGGTMTEQQDKYVKIINKNSVDLMYFIEKLIELSRTETLSIQPQKKTTDVLALVQSIVRYNEQLYKSKDIKISVTVDENFKKTIVTDTDILKGTIQNLFEIIIKSVDMGDIIINLSSLNEEEISSRSLKPGSYMKFSISSSALIFSEKELDCLFDPYKILDSTNRKNVLRSIVLASVKNLVQLLNGIVWVESKILKSTVFNIIIPIE